MFKKSIFIAFFLCLMAATSPTALAYHWWDYQFEWAGGDGDWHNPANFTAENQSTIDPMGPSGPDANDRIVIMPNHPDPRITGNTTTLLTGINSWDATGWGGQDAVLSIGPGALDVNFGYALHICAEADFDSKLGGTTPVLRGIVNQYDGTVRTIKTPGPVSDGLGEPLIVGSGNYGLNIGGGSSTLGNSYGIYNLYGGLADFPRIRLYFGEINIYGGTMQVTDGNFVFAQNHPENKINVNGGTLKIAGNWMNQDPCFPTLIKAGRIVSRRGGALSAPYFVNAQLPNADVNLGYTTISGTSDFNVAWNPIPEMNATNVHYVHGSITDPCYVTLTWNRGEPNVVQHDIYFGTALADVTNATTASAQFKGSLTDANMGDPCSWTISDVTFTLNANYYWRVDETQQNLIDDVNTVKVVKKGQVWKFTTHAGKAANPKPINGAPSIGEPMQLSWTAGDYAKPTAGHHLYFTTANIGSLRPTGIADRGIVTDTKYSFASLAPNWALIPGTTYFWVVDEITATGAVIKGDVWAFTCATYVTVDEFEDYNSTADMKANWLSNYTSTCGTNDFNNTDGTPGGGGISLVSSGTGKYMQFTYINSNTGRNQFYSEVRRAYPGGTTFTGGGSVSPAPAALRVDYLGTVANGVDPVYDVMYVALEDTAGNVAVYLNPDPNAAKSIAWTTWYSSLADISALGTPAVVNLQSVNGFCLGFGQRCLSSITERLPGDGNVMFDNIRLYSKTCNPTFAHTHGASADLDNDCDVDVNDLDFFADNWLWAAVPQHTITGITQPHKAPVLWYKFNEGTGTTVIDYGPGAYTVDVLQTGDVVWSPTGGRKGDACLNFNTIASQNTRVEVPVAAFDFMNDTAHHNNTGNGGSVSFTMWINDDLTVGDTMTNNWATVFSVWDMNWGKPYEGICYLSLPASWAGPRTNFQQAPVGGTSVGAYGPLMPVSFFGGKWNHWAAIKSEPNALIVYCNGSEVVRTTSADVEAAPLFKLPIRSFRIGMRGSEYSNWGKWSGQMQDFKVYDYALDANEVAYEATDGTGVVPTVPLVSNANLKLSNDTNTETIDFKDLAIMGQQWHTTVLWP